MVTLEADWHEIRGSHVTLSLFLHDVSQRTSVNVRDDAVAAISHSRQPSWSKPSSPRKPDTLRAGHTLLFRIQQYAVYGPAIINGCSGREASVSREVIGYLANFERCGS